MSKTAETSIGSQDLKTLLLAGLVEHGMAAMEADRISDQQVAKIWKRYGGCKRYFRMDHRGKETSEHRRKVIYMEWWTHRPSGEALQVFLQNFNITEERLRQIQAEGRKKKWAV